MASNGNGTRPLCGAKARQTGQPCRRPAGWGTAHPGVGRCKFHLGNTVQHIVHAALTEARVQGGLIEIEPDDALLYCVHRAAGLVAWYDARIAELEQEKLVGNPLTLTLKVVDGEDGAGGFEQKVEHPAMEHVYVRLRDNALEWLARWAKMAIDAGVEERRVRAAEVVAGSFVTLVEVLHDFHGISPEDRRRALPVIEQHLRLLERPGA